MGLLGGCVTTPTIVGYTPTHPMTAAKVNGEQIKEGARWRNAAIMMIDGKESLRSRSKPESSLVNLVDGGVHQFEIKTESNEPMTKTDVAQLLVLGTRDFYHTDAILTATLLEGHTYQVKTTINAQSETVQIEDTASHEIVSDTVTKLLRPGGFLGY